MDRYVDDRDNVRVGAVVRDITLIMFLSIAAAMAGCPQYNVWQQGLVGKAALKRAEQDRQITIQEAMAKRESASMLAEAEVARAKGVYEANTIISDGLGGPEGYLRYLYINALSEHAGALGQVIYVPTEAGLPILEATRLSDKK